MTLEQRRLLKGLGPSQASDQIGVSYKALLRAEDGRRVSVGVASKIATFYAENPTEKLALIEQLTSPLRPQNGTERRRAA